MLKQITLNIGESITVQLVSSFTGLDSIALLHTVATFSSLATLQTSKTGGSPYNNTSPYCFVGTLLSAYERKLQCNYWKIAHSTNVEL